MDRRLRRALGRQDGGASSNELAAVLSDVSALASRLETSLVTLSVSSTKRQGNSRSKFDQRKAFIRTSKARYPGISKREICRMMDASVERGNLQLQPLESWISKAGGKRTWLELVGDERTTKAVVKYISQLRPI